METCCRSNLKDETLAKADVKNYQNNNNDNNNNSNNNNLNLNPTTPTNGIGTIQHLS